MAVLEFWVPGVAATKGSVDVGRHGQVLHTQASKERAEFIRRAAVDAVARFGWQTIQPPGAVQVEHAAFLPVPAAQHGAACASWSRSGDLDKFERNLWDALSSAGVWADDVQVVAVLAWKFPARSDRGVMPGEYVLVRTVAPLAAQTNQLRWEGVSRQARERALGTGAVPRGM